MESLDDILFPETEHDSQIISLKENSVKKKFQPGDSIDHYTILSELGQGGMGIVYKAQDTILNRIVAIKIMLNLATAYPQIALKRFQREAEICAKLKHPYIVSVYTVGEYNSFPYIVMEYIEGVPINQYIEQHNESDWNLCANIIYKIVQALVYIHGQHIIHRDIKPSNILIRSNGDPVLMDFGIGKILHKQNKKNTLTREGEILGTLYYSSPEQATGKPVNEKTDIYSLGAVLYQLLTKQYPFYGNNTYTLLHQISTINPIPPCVLDKSIPEKLQEITLRSMEKNASYRYSSDELLTILHDFLATPDKVTVSQTYKKVIWLRYKKSSILTALFILLCCITGIVVFFLLMSQIKFNNNHDIENTIHLSTIQSFDLWQEKSDKLLCTLFKEFANMYKKEANTQNIADIETKNSYYKEAIHRYKALSNNDKKILDDFMEVCNSYYDYNIGNIQKLEENFNICQLEDELEDELKDELKVIQKHINNENWNKELYRHAGNICTKLTKYYYNKIGQNKNSDFQKIKIALNQYKKLAQNYLEKYVRISPSEKLSIYSQLSELEIYNEHTTLLENIPIIEQKIKTTEHAKETYWHYNNHFENICKEILTTQQKYKNNFNQEHFKTYLTLYPSLFKNVDSENEKKSWEKFFTPFFYCDEIDSILENHIKKSKIDMQSMDEEAQKILEKKYNFILEKRQKINILCTLANFYMTQDEQATLQKFYNDEKFYHTLMTISLSKNEEPFFRFLAIFALLALPDEIANNLVKILVDDNKKEEIEKYNISKEDLDLNQARLWAIILYDNFNRAEERNNYFKKILEQLTDNKQVTDEIALILLTHIDEALLTVINHSKKFPNLSYEYLLQNNKLEILLIKIQQDYIYNLNYLGNNIEVLKRVIETLINNSNQEKKLFGLQFLKRYDEILRHTQKKYLDEIDETKNKIDEIKKERKIDPKNITPDQELTYYENQKTSNENKNKNITSLINNIQEYQKSICKKFKDNNYDILNNGLQLQLIALYTLRRGNPKEYEKIINNMIDKAKENAQSLSEDIQIDIASYWIETGKIRNIIDFYDNFDVSSKVLIDMLARWRTKLAINSDSSAIKLINFLVSLIKNPIKLRNKELRTSLLYLFACCPLEKIPLIDNWRKNWLTSEDIYTSLGTIFSFSKYPNNPIFNKKKIGFSKKDKSETAEEQLIAIAQKCLKLEESYSAEKLKAIAYSLFMMKAYYYLNDLSGNKKEVKNEETLRKKLENLPIEIIYNIITNEELKDKITEEIKRFLYYGIALGYSNILYNDFKYCVFEDFEMYRNVYNDKQDPFKHHRNHFFNQFLNWTANIYTERLSILVAELQTRADIKQRKIIFEREHLKNQEIYGKKEKEHKEKAIDFNVNNLLRLKYNLKDYVQCLKQSIQYYERAIEKLQNQDNISETQENLQQLEVNIESILNNDFLLQRKLELGIVQCIIAQKMSQQENSEKLKEARKNIEDVQNVIKQQIFKEYSQLTDIQLKEKIQSYIKKKKFSQENIINSIIKNNIAMFQPLIQDYYICEKYLAFSYYIEKKQEEANTRLEKCKEANLWDYEIYNWLKEINNNDTKNYTEPNPYLFDRLFLKDLHNTKH